MNAPRGLTIEEARQEGGKTTSTLEVRITHAGERQPFVEEPPLP